MSSLTPDTERAVALLFDYSKKKLGITPRIVSAYRSCAEQDEIYSRGRSTPGTIATNAQGCQSWHVLGRAVDISLGQGAPRALYEELGHFWESMGGGWGGRFAGLDDVGHFEWHPGVKNYEICHNPGACQAGLQLSQSMFLAPPGRVGMGAVAMVVGVLVAGYIYYK